MTAITQDYLFFLSPFFIYQTAAANLFFLNFITKRPPTQQILNVNLYSRMFYLILDVQSENMKYELFIIFSML
jgi:hypothetical protein